MQTNSSTNVEDYMNDNKTTANNTNNINEQIKNANLYLQKHKLDVILLPNKKVKLSDLTSLSNQQQQQQKINYLEEESKIKVDNNNNDKDFDDDYDFDEDDDEDEDDDDYGEEDIESDDFIDDEDDDDAEKIDKFITENCRIEQSTTTTTAAAIVSNDGTQESNNNNNNDVESINHQHKNNGNNLELIKKNAKNKRKKREPSLKLIQKLTVDDLQLIVSCIQNSNAQVQIADVAKANYVDKILKVQLLHDYQLSNGSKGALLKKSMFPKEISLLFDSFIKSLCTERIIIENVRVFLFYFKVYSVFLN